MTENDESTILDDGGGSLGAERPDRIGPYRILQVLGEGGMGVVYDAEQLEPVKRRVAIKVIKLGMDTNEVVARFDAERQALAVLDHPNVAAIHDAGTAESGRPYFVMEKVPGIPITHFCDEHKLNTEARLKLFLPVCRAVQHAHQKGIIHRDLKPTNVLVAFIDGVPVPKIIDFGIAKAINWRLSEKTLVTELGHPVGTPAYMSPEQWDASGLDVDTRTDVYSLGVMLYELLVGRLPVEPEVLSRAGGAVGRLLQETVPSTPSRRLGELGDTQEVIAKLRSTVAADLKRELMGDLDWITMKAVDPDRTRRYETVNDVALEIGRYLNDEPVLARAPTVGYRVHKFVRRHVVGVTATALVALALIAGLTGTTIGMVRAVRAERVARAEQAKAAAINDFMQEVLGSADPEIGLGRDVTILEALDAAVNRIDESYPNQPEIAAALRETIGWTYVWYGRFDDAEGMLQTALEVRRSLFGSQHLDVAKSLYRLGVLHIDRGEPDAAEEPLQQSLEVRRSLLGSDHQDVAEVLNALAILRHDEGDVAGAESLFREAVAIQQAALAEERVAGKLGQVAYAKTLANLSGLLMQSGDLEEAEQLCRESVAIYRRLFDRPHPHLAANLQLLGAILREKGDNRASAQATREALAMTRAVYGNQNAAVAYVLLSLSVLSEARGAFVAAESTATEALEIARATEGNEDAIDASALRRLAEVHMVRGRYTSAAPLLDEALEISANMRGSDSWQTARLRSIQGECLTELRRYVEAEALLQAALLVLQSSERTSDFRREAVFTRTIERLAELYAAWGRPEESAEYRALLER